MNHHLELDRGSRLFSKVGGIGGVAIRLGEAQASPELENSRLGETELCLHFL
jgi:hypothetical protein